MTFPRPFPALSVEPNQESFLRFALIGFHVGIVLVALGLLSHAPYHGVTLTSDGGQAALDVVRRHRLLETYLAEVVGLVWDQCHGEAERLEHHLS